VAGGAIDDQGPLFRRVGAENLNEVDKLDRQVFPAHRKDFLRGWLALPESHTMERSQASG